MRQTMEQRVTRGIELLNDKGPKGWRRRIQVTKLDMGDPHVCVLGQAYQPEYAKDPRGTWSPYSYATDRALRGVLRSGERSATYGFTTYEDDDPDGSYDDLTAEWRRQLKAIPR